MGRQTLLQAAAWAAVANMIGIPQLSAAEPVGAEVAIAAAAQAFRVVDVELDRQGGFTGRLVDIHGQPIDDALLTMDNGHEQLQMSTDERGAFRAGGLQDHALRGGPYRIRVGQQVQMCRVWQHGTAPPSANTTLMIVRDDRIALGQNCGSPVACGLANCRDALAHPLIFGGIVAAAIAIPVAIHNADDDNPPAS